jgi:hypothetical protein
VKAWAKVQTELGQLESAIAVPAGSPANSSHLAP